ncbi:MAG: hypothetical protein KC731_19615, partial [Myxococcales bacterium]|nr:hypothetical protein [Myxococcales bacterium]
MRAWTLVLIIVLLALVTPARAQPSEPAAAEPTPSAPTLYERGRAALEAKDGPAARRLFREGLATAAPGEERFRMLLGLALAYELLGEPAWAVLHYRAFAIASEAHPDGATEEWQARRARIAQELGKLEEALA